MINSTADIAQLAWGKMDNLLPAVIQDANTGEVLMTGYMNQAAIEQSLATNLVTFYSRSKKRLWEKGETSGNSLKLVSIFSDCDRDCLLVKAIPVGPTCHLETSSCFNTRESQYLAFLLELETIIMNRHTATASESYTQRLFQRGLAAISQKVGEEAVETVIAAISKDKHELINESADLLYHLMVLLRASNLQLSDVVQELHQRNASKAVRT